MQLGIIKENGEIKGFRMPEFYYEKERFTKNELQAKNEKDQLRYADHALEFYARWRFESVGYGDSSCNIKEGDRMPAGSSIPKGCEMPEVVAKTIATLGDMKYIDERHREYVYALNCVHLERIENETIMDTLERFGLSEKLYRNARKRFAQLLSQK